MARDTRRFSMLTFVAGGILCGSLTTSQSASANYWAQVTGPNLGVDTGSDAVGFGAVHAHPVNISGGGGVLWAMQNSQRSDGEDQAVWLDGSGWHYNGFYFESISVPANSTHPWAFDADQNLFHYNGSSWITAAGKWSSASTISNSTYNYIWAAGSYNGSNCSNSQPAGPCFWWSTDGQNWTQEAGHGGGFQVATDGQSTTFSSIYAVDNANHVWQHLTGPFRYWSALASSKCGGGTFSTSEIAVFGSVYAVEYNGSSPYTGNVYQYLGGTSNCWNLLSSSNNVMYSIGFDNQGGTLYGVDGSANLWKWLVSGA